MLRKTNLFWILIWSDIKYMKKINVPEHDFITLRDFTSLVLNTA